jgi:hypothetical protein
MELPAYVIPTSSRKMDAAVRYPVAGTDLGVLDGIGLEGLVGLGDLESGSPAMSPPSWITYGIGVAAVLLVIWIVQTPGGYREAR